MKAKNKKTHPIKAHLDQVFHQYNRLEFLPSDPLKYAHQFQDPLDQEVVAYLASTFAYGRVASIFAGVEKVLNPMGSSPSQYVKNFTLNQSDDFLDFVYRFNVREDLISLILILGNILRTHGSIENFFMEGYSNNLKEAMNHFANRALPLGVEAYPDHKIPDQYGVRWFFTQPQNGGACKRLNLFLRWMVRKDDLDLGLWKSLSTSELFIPLDTHVSRVSKFIGLTQRNQANWKMVEEVSNSLKKLEPEDPIRYDFAISRLGILDQCNSCYVIEKCGRCDLFEICKAPGFN